MASSNKKSLKKTTKTKFNYSPETKHFLETLMIGSKLTHQQRNKINRSLNKGEPLPIIHKSTEKMQKSTLFGSKLSENTRRRTIQTIKQSGVFKYDKFISDLDLLVTKPTANFAYAYGNKALLSKPEENVPCIKKTKEYKELESNRYDELKRVIKEREDWYKEMEKLGEGSKYLKMIQLQILDYLNEIQDLKVQD